MPLTFDDEECRALFALIDELSGSDADSVFLWDGTDDIADPTTRACVKLFGLVGRDVPDNLRESTS